MASPSKSNLQMVPSNAPSQQEPRRGASQMPFVMLQTTESPSHQPSPHSAANQQSTFTLATAVQHTTSGGPYLPITAPYHLQQPLLEPTHQALPARSPPTSAVPMASWQGRQQSPLLVPGRAPTVTHTRIMVPPSTGRVNNAQSQHPHSVTWPPDQHALRNLTAADLLEQMIIQQLTAPGNVGGNLGTLHHIPSTPPLMQRSMDSLEVPGNSQLERALLPPPSPEPQLSPTRQPVGGAPFCSTPQKQYTNTRSVPDSSSCPASPLKPSLNAHDQRLQQFPLHTPTVVCRQVTSFDGRHVQAVNAAPPARRDGVARDLAPQFSQETESRSGRKRRAAQKEASKVNTSMTVCKEDSPSHQPRRLERNHVRQEPADTQSPQDVPALDRSDVLCAVTEQLARSSPQGMQFLRRLCRTLEAIEQALPSLERARSCIQDLRQSLVAVESELGDAERLQTSRSVDEPGGSASEAVPYRALQHQPLRTEGNTDLSPQNAALPQISYSHLGTIPHPSAISTAVNQCSSIFPPEGDIAQPMSLPEEGSSRADGSGKERVKSAHTTGAQFGPPASLPTEATSRHIPSDKRVTEGTTVEHLKERKINVPASLPHISWHGKMEEAERPEHYSSHCVQHQASPKKPRKSDKSILDPQVDPNSSNASSSPLEGYTLSRRGETAPKSYVRAASEATRKFWLETNENVQASTVTLQGAREKSYYPRKSPQKIASNVRLNEIPQVQESKPNVSRILFDVSTPDRETDIAPVRSRPTSEPTGDVDLCTLSNRQGVPESDVTGDEQRFMTAEGDETTGLGPYSAGAMILTQAEKSSSEAAQQEWLPAEAGLHSHGMNISGSATCDQRVQEHKDSTERYVKSNGECMYSTRKLPADAQRGAEGGQNVQAPYRGDAEISSVVAPEHPVVSPSVENSAVPQRTERRQTESDTSVSADSSTSQATDEPTANAECEVSTTLTTELRTGTRRRERKQRKPMFRGHYQQ